MGKDKLRPEEEPGGNGREHAERAPRGKRGGARVRPSVKGAAGLDGVDRRGLVIRCEVQGLVGHVVSLPKCNIKAQRVCSHWNNSSVGPEETRHEGKRARCTADTSQRVFLLFVPLMPHNPGQSGPFWACFQKRIWSQWFSTLATH